MIKSYRRHQAKAEEIGAEIHQGVRDEKFIVAHVTPGGGKTLMCALFSNELLKRDVERVLIVCPRKTLQKQMRDGFTVESLGLKGSISIGHRTTRSLLRDDLAGCVTTYQDVIEDKQGRKSPHWQRFVSEVPTLLVLDEAHHLQAPGWQGAEQADEAGWTDAVAPLVSAAHRVLLMTGTMTRNNGSPIAFVEYDEERKPVVHIRYTRRDALDEHAILNVSAKLCDGDAEYWHRFATHRHTLSTAGKEEESRALRSLLEDESYRNKVLSEAISEFAQYRETRNPRARMIVICKDQDQSRAVASYVRDIGYRAVLAISKEKDAHLRISRFRDRREGDVLVTCQMAYEGLDVPDCTHLVALTNIRSRPWLEQAMSRVTRFDPKCGLSWEEQCAYLYVPAYQSMIAFLSEWIDEQDASFVDPPTPAEWERAKAQASTFSPISGEMTNTTYADTFGLFSDADQKRIVVIDRAFPYLRHLPVIQRLKVARMSWPDDGSIPGVGEVTEQ